MFSQGSLQGLGSRFFEASSSETIKLSFIIIKFLNQLMSLKLHNSFQTQVGFLKTRDIVLIVLNYSLMW